MPKIAYETKRFADSSLDVIARANRILDEYAQQGFDLTLRQLYYQFVARGLISNTDRDYKRLGSIVNDGRLAGMIDWHRIVDRTRFLRSVSHWDDPSAIVQSAAHSFRLDKWADQPTRVEVWIEKDALVGVIEGACRELDVPYLSCRGYVSQSEAWGAAQRLLSYVREGQDVRILHLGDHDPSGIDMSRDIETRLATFLGHHLWDEEIGGAVDGAELASYTFERFGLDRLALNWDQIQQYDPPPNPAKVTDSRAPGYIAEHGHESWELDALEPSVIAALIRESVEGYRDDELWQAAVASEEEHRGVLSRAADRWPDVRALLNGDES